LVGNGGHQLNLFLRKGSDFRAPHCDHSEDDILPEHRNSQDGPEAADLLSLSQLIFGVSENVRDMNSSALKRGPTRGGTPPWAHYISLRKFSEVGSSAVVSGHSQDLAVEPTNESMYGIAQPRSVLDKRVEHRLEIER